MSELPQNALSANPDAPVEPIQIRAPPPPSLSLLSAWMSSTFPALDGRELSIPELPHSALSASPDAPVERNLWTWQEPFELGKLELPPLHSQMQRAEIPPVELERHVVGGRKVRCVSWNEHDLPVGLGAYLSI